MHLASTGAFSLKSLRKFGSSDSESSESGQLIYSRSSSSDDERYMDLSGTSLELSGHMELDIQEEKGNTNEEYY